MQPRDGTTPLVSVVIPTFNYGHFVTEAVDSALAQTYPCVEVIVVDDGSTDDTRDRLAAYGERVRYVYQPNAGLAAARNTGIREARGEFIALLDSDDLFHPRRLELQVPFLLARPEVGLVASGQIHGPSPEWPALPDGPPEAEPVSLTALLGHSRFGVCGVLVRRRCFDSAGLFAEELRAVEDRDMWIRIATQFPIVKLKVPLWWCRSHTGNMSKVPERMEYFHDRMLQRAFALPTLRNRPFLRRKAWSWAAFSAAMMYRDAGMYGRAALRAVFSLWLWPLPHPTGDIRPFARVKFLCLIPRLVLGGQPKAA